MNIVLAVTIGGLAIGCASPRFAYNNITPPSFDANAPMTNSLGIVLGESLSKCRQKIHWAEVPTEDLARMLRLSPFARTLSFIPSNSAAAWHDGSTNSSGWPKFIVAVFSEPGKTELIDLFRVSGEAQWPLLRGRYQTFLYSVRRGTLMSEVFAYLGNQDGEYRLDPSGRWEVHFTYYGYGGRFILLRVDAATGVVVDVRDVTI